MRITRNGERTRSRPSYLSTDQRWERRYRSNQTPAHHPVNLPCLHRPPTLPHLPANSGTPTGKQFRPEIGKKKKGTATSPDASIDSLTPCGLKRNEIASKTHRRSQKPRRRRRGTPAATARDVSSSSGYCDRLGESDSRAAEGTEERGRGRRFGRGVGEGRTGAPHRRKPPWEGMLRRRWKEAAGERGEEWRERPARGRYAAKRRRASGRLNCFCGGRGASTCPATGLQLPPPSLSVSNRSAQCRRHTCDTTTFAELLTRVCQVAPRHDVFFFQSKLRYDVRFRISLLFLTDVASWW